MSEILPAQQRQSLRRARTLLREGDVVVVPTDTVYGLAANAFELFAVRQIFELKQRPRDKALPIFIAQSDDLNLVARNVPDQAWFLLQKFWPGPLTVVLAKNPKLPDDVTAGQATIAVRIPNHLTTVELVQMVGRPLAVTSANLSGRPTPQTAPEIAREFQGQIPLILDDGPSPGFTPSTIVDLSVSPPKLLRPGPISVAELQEFLPDIVA